MMRVPFLVRQSQSLKVFVPTIDVLVLLILISIVHFCDPYESVLLNCHEY